jgi:thiol-disulfide isomerase/thioredoxin
MKWLAIIVMMITPGSPLFLKWYALRKARKNIGKEIPGNVLPKGETDNPASKVYYFHASYCLPCKEMQSMIDKLATAHPNLIKVDLDTQTELAKAMGVMATPTFVITRDNQISEAKVGKQREAWLRTKLTE